MHIWNEHVLKEKDVITDSKENTKSRHRNIDPAYLSEQIKVKLATIQHEEGKGLSNLYW
jgi:hypothetical protein